MDNGHTDNNKSTGLASKIISTKNPCAEVIGRVFHNNNNGCCPVCGAKEIEANTPRTVYECGSNDYDQRPGTFNQSDKCKPDPFTFAYSVMEQYIGATPEQFGLLSWQAMRDKMKQELRSIFEKLK